MKKTIWAVFLIGILVLAASGHAEIYKYIDENGQKRWTDDLSQVPKDQRPAAQRLVTEKTEATPGNPADDPTPANPASHVPETVEMVPDTSETGPIDALSRDALVKEKAHIHEQYRQLMEERQQLQQAIAETPSGDNRAELNKKATAYNQKADAYDKRLNDFNQKVARYNQQISAAQEKAAE